MGQLFKWNCSGHLVDGLEDEGVALRVVAYIVGGEEQVLYLVCVTPLLCPPSPHVICQPEPVQEWALNATPY